MSPAVSIARRAAGLAILGLCLVAASAGAQEVRLGTRPERPAEVRLDSLLSRGGYRLLMADTIFSREDRLDGDVLVLQATVRLEGVIRGNVFVVDGDLFLRPGSRVEGDVVVLGGGLYGSRLATVDGHTEYRPEVRYRVAPRRGGWVIKPLRRLPRPFELHGLSGLKMPAYDRVNSVTLSAGATARLVGWPGRPSLEVVARLRTASGDVEGSVRQSWHPSSALRVGVEAERTTRSNDGWVRRSVSNSLSYLFVGEDFRDYYRADRIALATVLSTSSGWSPSLTVQWEKGRSLPARDLFTFFGSEEIRPNPTVAEGEAWSLRFRVRFGKRTVASRLEAHLLFEAADSSVAGDFSFLMGEARARWDRPGLAAGHRIELFLLGRGDLAGRLPAQRWSGFGGRTTLPTLEVLARRGPRMLFGRLTYLVPIRPLEAGPLGTTGVFGRAALGSAWNQGESASFDLNLVAGMRLSVLEVAVAVDPRQSDLDPTAMAVLRLPGDL